MIELDERTADGVRGQLAVRAERLRAGEVVITGSVMLVAPGQRVDAELPPLGGLSVHLA